MQPEVGQGMYLALRPAKPSRWSLELPVHRPQLSQEALVGRAGWRCALVWPAVADGQLCFAVLTWEGEISAVSQDALQDVAWARSARVTDDWDEDFDSGKVRSWALALAEPCGSWPGP